MLQSSPSMLELAGELGGVQGEGALPVVGAVVLAEEGDPGLNWIEAGRLEKATRRVERARYLRTRQRALEGVEGVEGGLDLT